MPGEFESSEEDIKYRYKRVDTNDAEIHADRLETREFMQGDRTEGRAFGNDFLIRLAMYRNRLERYHWSPSDEAKSWVDKSEALLPDMQERVHVDLANFIARRPLAFENIAANWLVMDPTLMSDLQEYAPVDKAVGPLIAGGIHEMIHDSWIMREFTEQLSRRIVAGELMSIQLLEKILTTHGKVFAKQCERLEPYIEQYVPIVQEIIQRAFKDGRLPVEASATEQRLAEIQVEFVDEITANLEKFGGQFSFRYGRVPTISLSAGLAEKSLPKVLTHEYLHALSGRSTLEVLMPQADDDSGRDFVEQRAGLHFADDQRGGLMNKGSFGWLNEGMTEELTKRVLGELYPEHSQSYQKERELLRELLCVIDRKNLERAYFENFTPGAGDPIPYWRRFVREVNETYGLTAGPRFLQRLDELIQDEGIEAGLEFVKDYNPILEMEIPRD